MRTLTDLITNRTSEDIARLRDMKRRILQGGINALTAEEQIEYFNGLRGAYNYTDLNRVGDAVDTMAEVLTTAATEIAAYRETKGVADSTLFSLGFDPEDVDVAPKTDWTVSDVPTVAQMNTYLANIRNLRGLMALPVGTPTVPGSMDNLTIAGANAIEQILDAVDLAFSEREDRVYQNIDNAYASYQYAGEDVAF